MWKRVEGYSLYWAAAEKTGTVYLQLDGGGEGNIRRLSRQELAAIGDILRNESPVWFHSTRGDLSTETVPRDEEERI
ncbi:MAG: hypothetical protein JSW10_09590 [Pseudomonadota bacterium]|nr:MAG: hypothetical protein JSW10_09590 [Pseudomonadota bacterium]